MSAQFEEVAVEQVRANPANIREDLGDLERLSAEVKTIGVKQPLVVYPHPTLEGDYMIQDGHRRRQAAINAGLSTVPVMIIDTPARGELDDVEAMLTTGRNHASLSKMDEARGFQRLLDLGLNESTVGKKFKQPKSEILTKAKLSTAPTRMQAAYTDGRINLLDVKKLQDLEDKGQSGVLEKALMNSDFDDGYGFRIQTDRVIARATEAVARDAVLDRLSALSAVEVGDLQDRRLEKLSKPETARLTEAEHVAAGHEFYMYSYDTEPMWFKRLVVAKPEISDAEKEHKKQLRALNAELSISYQVRRQFIADAILSKDGAGEKADKELLFEQLWDTITKLDDETLGDISGIHCPAGHEDIYSPERTAWMQRVKAAVQKLSWRQQARAAAYAVRKDTDRQLRYAKNFDRTEHEWTARQRWLNEAQTHFGYRLDQAEQDTLALFQEKGGVYGYAAKPTKGYNRDLADDVTIIKDAQ